MKNQRGEVTTGIVVAIAVGTFLFGVIASTKLNPFKLFHKSAANKKASWTKQTEKSEPVLLFDKDKKAVAVGTKIEKIYDTGIEEATPKKTIGEKIGDFFAGLTTWGLVFVGVSLLFFGGTPIVWAWRKYAVVKDALKKTVQAIRDTKKEEPQVYDKLKPKLAAAHDKRDRVVIDKIKTELN